jgi:hypothetical protein
VSYSLIMRALLRLTAFISLTAACWARPANEEIRRIIVDRIDTQKQGVGIVVGVIDAGDGG